MPVADADVLPLDRELPPRQGTLGQTISLLFLGTDWSAKITGIPLYVPHQRANVFLRLRHSRGCGSPTSKSRPELPHFTVHNHSGDCRGPSSRLHANYLPIPRIHDCVRR
ncbi:hypothetical protein M422DRAFT_779271 [Sphaerobolus stellatus SS14]|uniref:Uncharacterized protein n=1 Tax=Sphaerobolus stellatus (strain SS14) TaxID=990650 RepID=A0A0C9VCW8_SPHS4|nr:hypothetical protein M422DRAFT_779271 [Sphaerobolus stellatus SS14]